MNLTGFRLIYKGIEGELSDFHGLTRISMVLQGYTEDLERVTPIYRDFD